MITGETRLEYKLRTPLRDRDIERLNIGDIVYLTGTIITARDQVHKRIVLENKHPPINMHNMVIFHAGPVVKRSNGAYEIVSIGSTTSMRMEAYEAAFIEKTSIKMIIGKGSMGQNTIEACRKHKVVVTLFPGGCGALGAKAVKRVADVYWLELGIPEALWVLEVENMGPLIVTIDSKGRNLFEEHSRKIIRLNDIIDRTLRDMNNVLSES